MRTRIRLLTVVPKFGVFVVQKHPPETRGVRWATLAWIYPIKNILSHEHIATDCLLSDIETGLRPLD